MFLYRFVFFYYIMWLAFAIIILLFFIGVKLFSTKENRNRFNKLPVGNLRPHGDNFVDSAGTVWIQRPYIMSLLHNPNKNYVFETYDKFIQSSSEAIADKKLFDKGIQVFTHGLFNYYSPFHNPFLHFYYDVLQS